MANAARQACSSVRTLPLCHHQTPSRQAHTQAGPCYHTHTHTHTAHSPSLAMQLAWALFHRQQPVIRCPLASVAANRPRLLPFRAPLAQQQGPPLPALLQTNLHTHNTRRADSIDATKHRVPYLGSRPLGSLMEVMWIARGLRMNVGVCIHSIIHPTLHAHVGAICTVRAR